MIGSAFGAAHIAAAMAALVLGTIVIGATKGTPFHRTIGAGYVAAMLIVNLSALAIYRLTGHVEAFHGLALLSLTLLTRGFVAALIRRPGWLPVHYRFMAWSYVGLLAATGSEIVIRIGTRFGLIAGAWPVIVAGTAVALLATACGFVLLPRLHRSWMQDDKSHLAM
ncbi:MAG TPA: DUF2306 domain-containing protein [Xanthobacteraceae bacterium]|nr:DUF2306 domain-containing protein [Xanthobacteraceae bacterium]